MKQLIISFLVLVLFTNQSKGQKIFNEIGIIENESPVLTINQSKVIKTFNINFSKATGFDGHFTKLELVELSGDSYILVFLGEKWKSSFLVKTYDKKLIAFTGVTCSTSDCSNERLGCIPIFDQGDEIGRCSECENKGKCTKTTSSTSLIE